MWKGLHITAVGVSLFTAETRYNLMNIAEPMTMPMFPAAYLEGI